MAALLLSAITATSAAADPVLPPLMPTPISGPDAGFYTAPADLADHANGDVLQSRAKPLPQFVTAGSVTQLEFRSTDTAGDAIPAVATVFLPPDLTPDSPVFVWDHPVNSLGLQCAPSQAMWSSDPGVQMREIPAIDPLLMMQHWVVVVPDHLGPDSAYGAARMGGQITLDAARAVTRDVDLPLHGSPVLLAGYSGGAMSAGFAAAMAPAYAPDLHVVAAALGGMPVDLEVMAATLSHSRHPAFGVAAAVSFGLEREYGDRLPISQYLNSDGIRFRTDINDACLDTIMSEGSGHNVDDFATSTELWDSQQTREILRDNSVGYFPGAPAVPVFEWHSPSDPLIPVPQLDAAMDRWQAAGTPVTRLEVPVPEHMSTAVLGMPSAIQFLGGVLGRQ